VSELKRKVYLEVLKNGVIRPPRDTIAICYLYAEAVNINRLFGLEAGGVWTYHAIDSENPDNTSIIPSAQVTIISAPHSVHAGAVVMNGKGIYENESIPSRTYHGVGDVKMVKFTYTPASGSCLET
jgi:hypothetical protein